MTNYGGFTDLGMPVVVVGFLAGTTGAFISKNGGAFVATTNPVTALGNNYFAVALTATECSTLGPIVVRYVAGANETASVCMVQQIAKQAGAYSAARFPTEQIQKSLAQTQASVGSIVPRFMPMLNRINRRKTEQDEE